MFNLECIAISCNKGLQLTFLPGTLNQQVFLSLMFCQSDGAEGRLHLSF